jgi:hypothetical protein
MKFDLFGTVSRYLPERLLHRLIRIAMAGILAIFLWQRIRHMINSLSSRSGWRKQPSLPSSSLLFSAAPSRCTAPAEGRRASSCSAGTAVKLIDM